MPYLFPRRPGVPLILGALACARIAAGLTFHTADLNGDYAIDLSETLRVVQLYNSLSYHCDAGGEDGYGLGPGSASCTPHSLDYAPQDWALSLSEVLRAIQLHNMGGYRVAGATEDNFTPRSPADNPFDTAGILPVFHGCAPEFVCELMPLGPNAGNVIQGIAVDPARGVVYASQDMDGDSGNDVQINALSLTTGESLDLRLFLGALGQELGHGQDLSIEHNPDGSYFLWTSHKASGLSRVDFQAYTASRLPQLFCATWVNMTPTTSLDGNYLAARVSRKVATQGDGCIHEDPSVGAQRVHIFTLLETVRAIEGAAPAPSPLHSFALAAQQMAPGLSFQGIAMDDAGIVYCLTGDTDAYDTTGAPKPKEIYAYDVHGNVLGSIAINIDREHADTLGAAGEYEPEGLSLVRDPVTGAKSLYFTLMFGDPGDRVKRLYVFKPCLTQSMR